MAPLGYLLRLPLFVNVSSLRECRPSHAGVLVLAHKCGGKQCLVNGHIITAWIPFKGHNGIVLKSDKFHEY